MIKIFLLAAFSFSLSAQTCKLPRKTTLKIGCTTKCGFMYKFRLSTAALRLGYPIDVVDLRHSSQEVDGVLIPGGVDIDPDYYLDQVSDELRTYTQENMSLAILTESGKVRDAFEYNFLKRYSSDEKYKTLPLLGICRGMQMMSVAQGIPLYLDIKTELGIKNRQFLFDKIQIKSSSLMKSLYGEKKIKGFKRHHQGLRVPYWKANQDDYPFVKVSAFSHDEKIAEALEYTHRPALGVQFHPEMSTPKTTNPILKWFLTKSCEHRISR